MAFTRHRQPPSYSHESYCSGVHDVDPHEDPLVACVSLDWITYMSQHGPLTIDGVQCDPGKFYAESKRYEPISTVQWSHLLEDEEYTDAPY